MPQFLISEPEAIVNPLADALDLVDFGIVLLDRDLCVRFINRPFAEIWMIPPGFMETGLKFRDLLNHGAANDWYAMPGADVPAYLQEREDEVRLGSAGPKRMNLKDGRSVLYRCTASLDGGRILTYADISQELRRAVSDAVERISAETRFSTETMETQAAYLASLAEATEESAQRAEAARLLLESEIAERRQLEIQLRRLATTDGLTGVLNRAEAMTRAQRLMNFARQSNQCLTVLMIDVDHFKAINDRYGHAGGDQALQHLVAALRTGIRQVDLLGRLGGEEFLVMLPGTSPEAALTVAERLRAGVACATVPFGDRLIKMTVSIGLASWRDADRSVEQIIARADAALYRAKGGGRNRIEQD